MFEFKLVPEWPRRNKQVVCKADIPHMLNLISRASYINTGQYKCVKLSDIHNIWHANIACLEYLTSARFTMTYAYDGMHDIHRGTR